MKKEINNKFDNLLNKDMTFDTDRVKRQNKRLNTLFIDYDLPQSKKAMELAKKYHTGKRKNGFDEVSHQFEIVSYAFPLFFKYDSSILDALIASMFLHDLIEDYPEQYNFTNLKKDFSPIVFEIVKRMTKTKSFSKTKKDYDHYYKGLEKYPLAVIAKLLDRIHNYETMSDRDFGFKIKYFREVDNYLIPMAKRSRKKFSEYEQIITFLIRQLKVLSQFHAELMIAKGEAKPNKDYTKMKYNEPSL